MCIAMSMIIRNHTQFNIILCRADIYPSLHGNTLASRDTLEAKPLMALECSSMDR